MYILGFETTGSLGSVALYNLNNDEIKEMRVDEPMGHLKNIIDLAGKLMTDEGVDKEKLAAVAVSVGPGSYTGIRIGVSSARAIAQGLDLPCISVPGLAMFKEKCDGSQGCAVIFNARRGQVYGAVFDKDGNEILEPGAYMLSDVTDAVDRLSDENIVFYGDGVSAYENNETYGSLLNNRKFAGKEKLLPRAEMVVRYAAAAYRKGRICDYKNLEPSYMRETEAEQKLKDGTLERLRREKMAKLSRGLKCGNH